MDLLIACDPNGLAARIRARHLHKRALDLPASEVGEVESWVAGEPDLLERVEDQLGVELGMNAGDLLLDFPARTAMLGVNIPLRTRGGAVERLTDAGRAGHLGLPRVADELYRSARRLRIFVSQTPNRSLDSVLELLALPADEVNARVTGGRLLLN
jgi:uncharacterized protein